MASIPHIKQITNRHSDVKQTRGRQFFQNSIHNIGIASSVKLIPTRTNERSAFSRKNLQIKNSTRSKSTGKSEKVINARRMRLSHSQESTDNRKKVYKSVPKKGRLLLITDSFINLDQIFNLSLVTSSDLPFHRPPDLDQTFWSGRSIMITLSLLIMGLCFFLHRKLKSSAGTVSLHTLPWTDENLEVYTLSGQEEITGIYLPPTPSPPPAYETVVKVHKKEDAEMLKKSVAGYNPVKKVVPEDDDLPSYETAIKLREQGYI